MIDPHRRQHRRLPGGVRRQAGAERSGGRRVVVEDEELLELIHRDDGGVGGSGERVGQCRVGIAARREQDHGPSLAPQRRHQSRAAATTCRIRRGRRRPAEGSRRAVPGRRRLRGRVRRSGHHRRRRSAPTPGRALRRDRRWFPLSGEGGVLGQDGGLECDQLGAGIDAELVTQRAPSLMQRPQCIGLAATAVLRERQRAQRRSRNGSWLTRASPSAATWRCSPLASRASRRSSSALRRSSSRRAASLRAGAHPSTSSNGGPRHSDSAAPGGRGSLWCSRRGQLPTSLDHGLEALGVDVVSDHGQAVATGCGLDRARPHRLAQPHHAAVDDLRPRRGDLRAPHRVCEAIRGHHLAGMHRQSSQHRTVARTQWPGRTFKLKWSEQPDVHPRSVIS